MFTAEIDFQTETEWVQLTRTKFETVEEASAFAIAFAKPYIENCKLADGRWQVFDSEQPQVLPLRHVEIRSLLSLRADQKLI